MKAPFDLQAVRARMAAACRPEDPTDHQHPHVVRLRSIGADHEAEARWGRPQRWCRDHVDHAAGHQWSRRVNPRTKEPEFSFSDAKTAMVFALLHR